MMRVTLSMLAGTGLTLLSTFIGQRSAMATYPDIMGCELACRVAATGWPLLFIKDYTGMSVVNTADILEVWFAADRFLSLPFLVDVGFWAVIVYAVLLGLKSRARSERSSPDRLTLSRS